MNGQKEGVYDRCGLMPLLLGLVFILTSMAPSSFVGIAAGSQDTLSKDVTAQQIVFSGSNIDHVSIALDPWNRIDVVWTDYRDGNGEIYYLKLNEDGLKLHNDMRLTDTSHDSIIPMVLPLSNSTSMITWVENRIDGFEIMATWIKYDGESISQTSEPVRIRQGGVLSAGPVVKNLPDGSGAIMWSEIEGPYTSIFISRLGNGPVRDLSFKRIIEGIGNVTNLDFEISPSGNLSIVWNGIHGTDNSTDHNYGIYYMVADSNDTVQKGPIRKSITGQYTCPDIAMDGERIYLIFSSDRYSISGLILTVFTYDGIDILDDVPVSNTEMICHDPSIRIDGSDEISILWWEGVGSLDLYGDSLNLGGFRSGSVEGKILYKGCRRSINGPPHIIDRQKELRSAVVDIDGKGVFIISRTRPDIIWTGYRTSLDGIEPIAGENLTIEAFLHNSWERPLIDVQYNISVYFEDEIIDVHKGVIDLDESSTDSIFYYFYPAEEGNYELKLSIDPEGKLDEANRSNNVLKIEMDVKMQSFDISEGSGSKGSKPTEEGIIEIKVVNHGSSYCDILIEEVGERSSWLDHRWDKVELEPGESDLISFIVVPPEKEISGDKIFLFKGVSNRSKQDSTLLSVKYLVESTYHTIVDLGNYERNVDPGKRTTLPLSITNDGNSEVTYELHANSSIPLDLDNRGNILPVSIGPVFPGKKIDVPIGFTPSMNLTPGTQLSISLVIESIQGGQTFMGEYNLTIAGYPLLHIDFPDGDDMEINDDWEPFDVPLFLENMGNTRDVFHIEIPMDPEEWFIEIFEPDDKDISLSPGENRTIDLHIIPPGSPNEGTKNILISVVPLLRPDLRYQKSLSIDVGSKYDVDMDIDNASVKTLVDAKSRILVSFTNTGNIDATFLLSIEGPGSHTAFVNEIGGSRYLLNESGPLPLQRGGTFSFWLELEIPEGSRDEMIYLHVTCLEDREVSTIMQISVEGQEAQVTGVMIYVYGGALFFSLLIILFIVTRFLRSRRDSSKTDLMDDEFDDDEDY